MAKQLGESDNTPNQPTHEQIAQRAQELFERSGRIPGRDVENWLEAEAQLRTARRPGTENKIPSQPKMPARPAQRQPAFSGGRS